MDCQFAAASLGAVIDSKGSVYGVRINGDFTTGIDLNNTTNASNFYGGVVSGTAVSKSNGSSRL